MTAPLTLAVLLCPMCKDVWHHASATFRWPLEDGGPMPELIAFDCPNGCSLAKSDDEAMAGHGPGVWGTG